MKIKRIIIALVALTLALCLASCSGTKIKYNGEDGSYTDKKGNVYLRAPSAYEPVSYQTDKTYGKLIAGIGEFELYQISNAEKGAWVTTADGDVLYKDGVKLPTLTEFSTDRIWICREGESIHAFARMEKADEIAKVLREYLEGESIPQPIRAAEQNLRLRLASEEYPFLYYRLTYLEYANDVIVYTTDEQGNEIETNYGKYFIFNRDDGRFVPVGDTVHKYVE